MPTKRTSILRTPAPQISAAALRAFRAGDGATLQAELGRRPWQNNPLDVSIDGAPPRYFPAAVAADYKVAQRLRGALLDADRATRAALRHRLGE